jgi:hypothetical protein
MGEAHAKGRVETRRSAAFEIASLAHPSTLSVSQQVQVQVKELRGEYRGHLGPRQVLLRWLVVRLYP